MEKCCVFPRVSRLFCFSIFTMINKCKMYYRYVYVLLRSSPLLLVGKWGGFYLYLWLFCIFGQNLGYLCRKVFIQKMVFMLDVSQSFHINRKIFFYHPWYCFRVCNIVIFYWKNVLYFQIGQEEYAHQRKLMGENLFVTYSSKELIGHFFGEIFFRASAKVFYLVGRPLPSPPLSGRAT